MAFFSKKDKTADGKLLNNKPAGSGKTDAEKKIEAQLLGDKENKRVIKKGADLNIFKKTYQYVGLMLPLSMTALLVLLGYMFWSYYDLTNQKNNIETTNRAYLANINSENLGLINILSGYNRTLEKFNDYQESALNFSTIFNTIENYLPKEMERTNLRIKLNEGGKLGVTMVGKVTNYEAYISMLSVIDRCSFTNPEDKRKFIQLNRVEFGRDSETISDNKSVTLQFDFDINKNPILKDSYYQKMNKQFSQYGNYLYLVAVTNGKQQDIWSETGINYSQQMDEIIQAKQKFVTELAAIANIETNGYHIPDKGENFIAEYQTQNRIFDYLIAHYTQRKTDLNTKISDIFDTGDVKYNARGQEMDLLNVKKPAQERLKEIDMQIAKITLLKRYNEYLLDNNQLKTFTKLKEEFGNEADAKISEIILQRNILVETDALITSIAESGLTPEERDEIRKATYVELYNFIKDADASKIEALKLMEKYVDTFYKDYYNDNLIKLYYEIANAYIISGFNENVFANLNYRSFNFNAVNANANFSYKKRFYLTLKNDSVMRDNIIFLSDEQRFADEMKLYDEFKQQENDIITFNNSNISCLNRDIRNEMLNVYDSVLSEQNVEMENDKKASELNIIIETLKTDQQAASASGATVEPDNSGAQPAQPAQ